MKVTIFMCHPDDELIFGWPVLYNKEIEKDIFICSSDANNPERQWCKHRKNSLFDMCVKLGLNCKVLDYNSEFYRTPSRYADPPLLEDVQRDIAKHITEVDSDVIFTHNPVGEYGHLDHKFVFDLVTQYSKVPVWFTDICLESNWHDHTKIPKKIKKHLYKKHIGDYNLDLIEYELDSLFYRNNNVWTWNKPPVEKCSIYELE